MAFESIKPVRRRLAEEVYDQILGAILSGEIAETDRLVQERLAARLEISRTPVREALLRLEQEGILRTADRGGFVLRRPEEDEVREVYEARMAVEGQAIRLAAQRGGAAAGARLARVIEAAEALPEPALAAYFDANRRIHRAIVIEGGNRWLLETFDTLWNRGSSFRLFAAIGSVDLARSLGAHGALAQAVASGDGAAANAAMIDHIEDGLALQLEAMGAARASAPAPDGTGGPPR